jgi:hypothetical protein
MQKGMNMYKDNVLKEENSSRRVPRFKNEDGVQKLVTSMSDDLAVGEWELRTVKDMKWIDNHQRPMQYCSREFIKSLRWLLRHPEYAEHLIYAPQSCFNSDTPPKRLHTEMHTVDRWKETQIR